jgi:exodeoxyribonuclease III
MVKIVSWNVNGLRTRIVDHLESKQFSKKTQIDSTSHLGKLIDEFDPDIICFGETRCSFQLMEQFEIPGFYRYSSSSELEGARSGNRYSGTAIWTKLKPYKVLTQLPFLPQPNLEGRFIALYFNRFILIHVYQPNSGSNFQHRITEWDPAMGLYLQFLKDNYTIPIIWTGDLNVAHTHQDVFFGDNLTHQDNSTFQKQLNTNLITLPGFTKEERDNFSDILSLGFTDVWRHLHPDQSFQGFTWWDMRRKTYRLLDKGWRIDYFVINNLHLNLVEDCQVFKHIGETQDGSKIGSDHAPIGLTITL